MLVVAVIWPLLGLVVLQWLVCVLVLVDGRSRRMSGADFRMDLALTASICWVPVLTLLGSVGSGWAFYILPSDPYEASRILALTVGGTLGLIGLVARALATHYSGESLFLWAQGVDPSEAIRQLRDVRDAQHTAVFCEVARLGASHGSQLGHIGKKGHAPFPWGEVARVAMICHWKLLLVLVLPALFLVSRGAMAGFSEAPSPLPAMLIGTLPATFLWVAVTYLVARGEHRAWTARERVLIDRMPPTRHGSRLVRAIRLLATGEPDPAANGEVGKRGNPE